MIWPNFSAPEPTEQKVCFEIRLTAPYRRRCSMERISRAPAHKICPKNESNELLLFLVFGPRTNSEIIRTAKRRLQWWNGDRVCVCATTVQTSQNNASALTNSCACCVFAHTSTAHPVLGVSHSHTRIPQPSAVCSFSFDTITACLCSGKCIEIILNEKQRNRMRTYDSATIHQRCVRTFRCRYVYSLSSTQRHASPMYLCDSESESSLDPHTVLRWQSLVRPSHCSVKIICCLVCSSAVRCTGLFRLHHFDFWFDFFHFLFTARALRASLKRQLPTERSKDLLNTIIRIKIQVVSRFADFLLTILCPFRFVFGGFRRSIEAIVRRKRLWINVESFKWMPIHEAYNSFLFSSESKYWEPRRKIQNNRSTI